MWRASFGNFCRTRPTYTNHETKTSKSPGVHPVRLKQYDSNKNTCYQTCVSPVLVVSQEARETGAHNQDPLRLRPSSCGSTHDNNSTRFRRIVVENKVGDHVYVNV